MREFDAWIRVIIEFFEFGEGGYYIFKWSWHLKLDFRYNVYSYYIELADFIEDSLVIYDNVDLFYKELNKGIRFKRIK